MCCVCVHLHRPHGHNRIPGWTHTATASTTLVPRGVPTSTTSQVSTQDESNLLIMAGRSTCCTASFRVETSTDTHSFQRISTMSHAFSRRLHLLACLSCWGACW